MMTPMTLVYLRDGDKVLLLKRREDKPIQPGVWLGVGGKVEPGEELAASACREFLEETGLEVQDPVLRGTLTWTREKEGQYTGGVLYIFGASSYTGELIAESDEGYLAWHNIADLPDLEHFAKHQYAFINHALGEDKNFYTGYAAYKDKETLFEVDSAPYFAQRVSLT